MKWVTREHVKVDRVACPWLIRRFLDPEAEFIFVPADEVLDRALADGGKSFDVEGADFHHEGDWCTFEKLAATFRPSDRALRRLGLIVRGADVPSSDDCTPESAGLRALAEGFRAWLNDDHEILRQEFCIYDALYEWCKLQVSTGHA